MFLWRKADRSGAHPPAQVSGSENNRTLIVQLVLQCQRILQQRVLKRVFKKDLGGEKKKLQRVKRSISRLEDFTAEKTFRFGGIILHCLAAQARCHRIRRIVSIVIQIMEWRKFTRNLLAAYSMWHYCGSGTIGSVRYRNRPNFGYYPNFGHFWLFYVLYRTIPSRCVTILMMLTWLKILENNVNSNIYSGLYQ